MFVYRILSVLSLDPLACLMFRPCTVYWFYMNKKANYCPWQYVDKLCLSSLTIFSPSGTMKFGMFPSWALFMHSEYFTSLFKVHPEAFLMYMDGGNCCPEEFWNWYQNIIWQKWCPVANLSVPSWVQIGSKLHFLCCFL